MKRDLSIGWRAAAPILFGAERACVRRAVIFAGVAVALLGLAIECQRYFASGVYLDHIEGSVVIGGWQYLQGWPLYEMQDGAPRFASFYGPLVYLLEIPPLLILGPSVAASKLPAMLALAATLGVMAVHFLRRSPGQAPQAMLFVAAGLLMFSPASFWVRPDPAEILLVAIAVAAARGQRGGLWVGICIGLAVNLKVHAFFYFLPVLFDFCLARRRHAAAVAAASSLAVFALPFFVPGISFDAYVAGLTQQFGGRPPLRLADIGRVAGIVPVLLVPLAAPFLARGGIPRDKAYAGAALAALVLLIYPAAFSGSGAYHFLPLLPVLADAYHRLRPERTADAFAPFLILAAASVTAPIPLRVIAALQPDRAAAATALLVARDSGGRPVQVGYGDNLRSYRTSQLSRTVLALHGEPALVDAQVLMELRQAGIDGSARWTRYLTGCRIARWLIPVGETPFAMPSIYARGAGQTGSLFGDAFRRAFFANYRLTRKAGAYDVWDCRDASH